MRARFQRLLLPVLNHTTLILFGLVMAVFGALSPKFFAVASLSNLLVQTSAVAIVGVGMTFVLLTAGVDLSVGAVMFVAAAVAGKLVLAGASMPLALLALLAVGPLYGAFNALLVTRLRIIAFIATLGTLYVGRGLGLWITQTRAMNLPDGFLAFGSAKWLGVPLPLWISAAVVAVAQVTLSQTPFGRQIYAVGNNLDAAQKAGLNTRRLLATVYVISGLCAAIGGILSLAQLGAVSPTFGTNREFSAIAAAVLGGTSLFGGRGAVFPGTVLGALLIQGVENGLVILNADPYLYPLVTSVIIFVAVLADASRNFWLERLGRRRIYHAHA